MASTQHQISEKEIKKANNLRCTHNHEELSQVNCFIVTVTRTVNKNRQPNLKPLISATELIGRILKPEDIVIYELQSFQAQPRDLRTYLRKTFRIIFQ